MSSRPELHKGPEQDKEFLSYSDKILSTAADRSKRTRELLPELIPGVDTDEFIKNAVEEANKVKPGINIVVPKSGEYLAKTVLELQYKFLGFPKEDNQFGCDGKLGSFTLNKLKESLPLLNKYLIQKEKHVSTSRSARTGLMGELRSPASAPKLSTADNYNDLPVSSEKLPTSEVQYRNTKNLSAMREDHEQNLSKLKILDSKLNQIKRFIDIAKQNQRKYELVADRTGIPWELIAALHYRESGMKFDTYLHNGQKLGKPTTMVPKGILFGEGEWELAAIHALGGQLTPDELRGNQPKKYFQNIRTSLGIDKNTQELSKLFTFAEIYNGTGYRPKGVPTPYIYSGTNMYNGGLFYADNKFSADRSDRSVGVAALVIALKKAK